jgi:uncharacterized membrane protein YfcA
MPPEISLAFLALTALVFGAGAVQGFLGFGYGLVVMSVMTLSRDLVHATAFVNLTALGLSLSMVWSEPRRVIWPLLLRILPAMFAGMAIGLVALREVERDVMVPLLGVLIVATAAWNLAQPRLHRQESWLLDLAFGGAAGVLSGAFNTGGPPLVVHLYRRPEPPLSLVVTLQAIFIGSGLGRVVMAGTQGLMPASSAWLALAALPAVVAGTLVGMAAARRTRPERFRRVAWLALGGLGVVLIVVR